MCNQQCDELRRHESLDQTRAGTIVCGERTTTRSLLNAIVNNEWDNAFTGNRTHLRIEGLGGFGLVYTRIFLKLASFRLRCCKSKTLAYLKNHWMMMNKQYLMNLFFY